MKKTLDIMLPRLIQQAKTDHIDRFVVAAIISKNSGEKVLCLKRASHDFMPGLYELPSGRVNDDEEIITALLREIKEETNLDNVEITDYLSSFDYRSQSGKLTRQLNFVVTCENTQNLALNDNEHEGYSWVSKHEMSNYNISRETKNVIHGFLLRKSLSVSPTQTMIEGWNEGIEKFVVGGIISQNEKILMLKRASSDFMGGIYELPSGTLESGESVEMGITREIKEETNLDISQIGRKLPHFDYRSQSGQLTRQLNYEIRVNDMSLIKLSGEHEGFSWVHQVEFNAYPISKEVRNVMEHFLPKKPSMLATAITDQGIFNTKRDREDQEDINLNQAKKANQLELN